MSVQRIVNDLQKQGVLSSRLLGAQREVRLNPGYFAAPELRALLLRLSFAEPRIVESIEALRLRPRRADKPL